MNDKNLINCLAQKQLKELDFEIKFNSSLKNKFNVGNSKNPFESNFANAPQSAFNNHRPADQFNSCSLFNYDKNSNLIQKSDDPFESFGSCGYQAASGGPSTFAHPSNLAVQNFNSFGALNANNLTRPRNNNLPGSLNNWNQKPLMNGSNTTNFELSPQASSNSPAFNGNSSLFGRPSLNYNCSSSNSKPPFNTNFLQSASPSSASPANPSLKNFNPFLNYQTNQPNSQSNNHSHFNPNSSLNSTFSSNLSDDLSSSLNGFSFLSSNDFSSLLDAVPSTNSLTQTHLPSQTKVTNCDLINLDSNSGHPVAEDKYSIFKEIELSSDKNETKRESKTDNQPNNVNAESTVNEKGDRLSRSADFSEDFGEFKSFGESFGDFKSYSDFSAKPSSCAAKISESDKITRFERLLNGVLSIFHRSFNVLNIYYDEKSVLTALSTKKGREFYLDLREVYYISKRIASSLLGMQSCEKLLNLIGEINNLWSLLDKMMSSLQVTMSMTLKTNENVDLFGLIVFTFFLQHRKRNPKIKLQSNRNYAHSASPI